jgi:hypothetical protein
MFLSSLPSQINLALAVSSLLATRNFQLFRDGMGEEETLFKYHFKNKTFDGIRNNQMKP